MAGRESMVLSMSCKWSKQLYQVFVCVLFDFHPIPSHKLVIGQCIFLFLVLEIMIASKNTRIGIHQDFMLFAVPDFLF